MRLTCPVCGDRDRREFYYQGAASILNRPDPDAGIDTWDDYLHNRDNPAGLTQDLWYHEAGCSSWIVVTRNTVTHEVIKTALAQTVKGQNT
jgi:heterotetrameric sarcosine oxidase delta subunit